MIEAKDLDKHPIRYANQYLEKLLSKLSKKEILEELRFSVREKILIVVCKTDEGYEALKKCEKILDKEFIHKLGLEAFLFQYEKYYLVLKIIKEFAKQGLTEVSFEEIFTEVNKYTPQRTAQMVKNTIGSFAADFIEKPYLKLRFNEDFLAVRGLSPLVKHLKPGNYQILLKVKSNKKSKLK